MLKKWIYILTVCCLANSLFCFYTGPALQGVNGQPLVADVDSHAGSNTLLDLLIGQFQDEDDEDGKAPFKTFCKHSWSIVRGFALNVQTPLKAALGFFRLPGLVRHVYGNHLIRKAILPTYYNFLFRLSPF